MKDLSSSIASFKEYFLSVKFWRMTGFVIAVALFTFIFLGFAITIIVQGTFFLILRLSTFWKPAQRLLGTFSLPTSEKLANWGRGKWVFVSLLSIPELLFIAAGFWLLFDLGFKNQNFIYLLFFK